MPQQSLELFTLDQSTPDDAFAHGAVFASGSLQAGAELRRGIDLSAGVDFEAGIGGEIGEQVAAVFGGRLEAGVGVALQAVVPINLFEEAGLIARFRAQAAVAASVSAALRMHPDVFRALLQGRVSPELEPLLRVFLEEVEIHAGIWGRVAFSAEILAEAVVAGSLLPEAGGGPGFTFSAQYNAGWGFGSGCEFIGNIGIENPQRLIARLGDMTSDLVLAQAEAVVLTLPPARAAAARQGMPALRVLLPLAMRGAFQVGLEVARAPGPQARERAARAVVEAFLHEAQELLLQALVDFALRRLTALLGADSIAGRIVALSPEERTALGGQLVALRDRLTSFRTLGPADLDAWLLAVVDLLPPLEELLDQGLVPAAEEDDVREVLAILWAAGVLAHRVAVVAADPAAAPAGLFQGALAQAPDGSGVAAFVAERIEKPAGSALTLVDLVEFLVGVDPMAEFQAAVPEAAGLIEWLADAAGTPAGQIVQRLLVDLADPDGDAVDTLLQTLGEVLSAAVSDEIVPNVLTPIKQRDPQNEGLRLFVDELVVPTLVALPAVVIPNLPQLDDEAGRRRFQEAVSAVLLQSIGRFVVETVDILLEHGLRQSEDVLRETGREIGRRGEESPVYGAIAAVATGAFLPVSLLPADIEALLDLCADIVELVNDRQREPVIEALALALTMGLGAEATREASLEALSETDAPPREEDLDALLGRIQDGAWEVAQLVGPRALELLLLRLWHQIEFVAQLIEEGAKAVVAAAKEAAAWLARQVERLQQLLAELVRQVAELIVRIARDVRAMTDHLRGLAAAILARIRAYGRSLIEPLIKDFPGWAKDALRDLYNALFDAVAWIFDLPLRILGDIAGWVEEIITARLQTASYDEQIVRAEVRQRLASAGIADLKFNLYLEVWGQKIFDLGRITIPAGAIVNAIADAVLGDAIFTQTVRGAAADAVQLQSVRAQESTVRAALTEQLDEQQATAAAGQLTPGQPLAVRFLSPAERAIVAAPAAVSIRVDGINRTFVEPTLGVPRRVTVIVSGREYEIPPASWRDVPGGLALDIAVAAAEPAEGARPVRPAATLDLAELSRRTLVNAELREGRELVFAPASTAAVTALNMRREGGPRVRAGQPLTVLPAEEAFGGRVGLAGAVFRARASGGALLERPVEVRAAGAVAARLTDLAPTALAEREEAPELVLARPRPGAVPQPAPVAGDGSILIVGQRGLNVVQVAVSDGEGRQASGSLSFFLAKEAPAPPRVAVDDVVFDPPGPDWQGEYVVLRSHARGAIALDGWTLRDLSRHVYRFGAFTLRPRRSVRVWTRPGTDDEENVYWGRRAAVWNNRGDSAVLADGEGREVHRFTYGGG